LLAALAVLLGCLIGPSLAGCSAAASCAGEKRTSWPWQTSPAGQIVNLGRVGRGSETGLMKMRRGVAKGGRKSERTSAERVQKRSWKRGQRTLCQQSEDTPPGSIPSFYVARTRCVFSRRVARFQQYTSPRRLPAVGPPVGSLLQLSVVRPVSARHSGALHPCSNGGSAGDGCWDHLHRSNAN